MGVPYDETLQFKLCEVAVQMMMTGSPSHDDG
jgi:hypothetical protein